VEKGLRNFKGRRQDRLFRRRMIAAVKRRNSHGN
jgi:hypothetical protein